MKLQFSLLTAMAILFATLQPAPAALAGGAAEPRAVLIQTFTGTGPVSAVDAPTRLPGLAVDPAVNAPSAVQWFDGPISYSTVINCPSQIFGNPQTEKGIGTYTGFLTDLALGQPTPNQVYYIHIVATGMGNPCTSQYIYPEIALPSNTSFAFDVNHPMVCRYIGVGPVNCPAQLLPSVNNPGAYSIPGPAQNGYVWPLPQTRTLEFQLPVVSTTTLSSASMVAYVKALDGNYSPWLNPSVGVYVFSNTPALFYPYPSTDSITKTTAKSWVTLAPAGQAGTLTFEIGLSPNSYTTSEIVNITNTTMAQTWWEDWTGLVGFSLLPGTTYYWRARFQYGGGNIVLAEQSFSTLPDGLATVGSGSAASCTEAAWNAAFLTLNLKQITFNCGPNPVTIPLASSNLVTADLTIDGGHLVTLQGSGQNQFLSVNPSVVLKLNNLTLSGGGTNGCGGAIFLSSPPLTAPRTQLWTNQVRFLNNHALNGGAVCQGANSYSYFVQSYFKGNTATVDGGAVYDSGGTLEIRETEFTNNSTGGSAVGNGGAIRSAGDLLMFRSTVASNSAINTGGGLYIGGSATVENSTVSSNAALKGGGIENTGKLILTNTTIAYNVSTDNGKLWWQAVGGLDSANSISALLKNTLIAGNSPRNCNSSNFIVIFDSAGGNLDSDGWCSLHQGSDLNNVDPRLQSLAFNGGVTRTHALPGGSPAIDRAVAPCPSSDQRGILRPIGAACDIGAFEYKPLIFLPLVRH